MPGSSIKVKKNSRLLQRQSSHSISTHRVAIHTACFCKKASASCQSVPCDNHSSPFQVLVLSSWLVENEGCGGSGGHFLELMSLGKEGPIQQGER